VTDRLGEFAGTADTGPRIDVGQLSVVGRVRTGNEDSVLCEPPESLLRLSADSSARWPMGWAATQPAKKPASWPCKSRTGSL